ncbi:uncharacterized protein LOC143037494 [Oratosquilla oratoria]|uniref:uncharacterized protein LOC143037494 n=1 Tax=Oratosquilla oratoria TaxID=337810 RepID=UPI003F761E08
MSLLSQELLLPITQSSLSFFHDSFFEQSRKHFQMALKDITDRHGFSSPDFLTSYRSLRQRDLKEENQAISITDQHNAREITVDVKDFKEGDLSVKAEGHSVEVEGRAEKKEGNSISTHSFRRRFSLPRNVDMASVTSTVSSDGILTISAPKKIPDTPREFNIPIETKTTGSVDIKTQESSSVQNMSQEGSGNIAEPITPLPVMLRGSFFEDSFFRDAHRDFTSAMDRVLRKSGAEPSPSDNFKQYRTLRNVDFSNDTQAFTLSEDDSSYKIVLDAQDFKNGDVQLKVVGNNLVVEGRVEKAAGNTLPGLTFQRRFALPSNISASDITAALSSDGVLTILAKKKDNLKNASEHIIPIQLENNADPQAAEKAQEARSIGQQHSEPHAPNETKGNEEQEKQLQQQAQQIHKQEQMLAMKEGQLRQQQEEIERQKAHNQKLQKDSAELQTKTNATNVNEKEENQAALRQQPLQQPQPQQVKMVSPQQQEQKAQKVQSQKLERNGDLFSNDTSSSRKNKPVWTPKIGSLETGFLNIKKFETEDQENA